MAVRSRIGPLAAIWFAVFFLGGCSTSATPISSSTGGGICDPEHELWDRNYDDAAVMRAEVPSLAQLPELAPGVQTILTVYADVPGGAIGGLNVAGSFAPVSTAGPGDRVICIYQAGQGYRYYTHVDLPDRAP
jgi:hypothetical protein